MREFNPGEVITATVKYSLPHAQLKTLTGTVVARPKWLQTNEIAITSPGYLDGIAVINLQRVAKLTDSLGQDIPVELADTTDKEWTVLGSKGQTYRVVRRASAVKCSCPGFQFRGNCRHIHEVV